jgi:site-specific DNA-cytosine methylase
VKINSALVSAQNRERLYWANFPIEQPTDKSVLLKDIIENGFIDRSKAYCIDANYWKGGNFTQYYTKARRQLVFKDKAQTILSTIYKENAKSMMQRKKLGLVVSDGDYARKLTPIECERLQTVPDNYTNCVSDTQRYKMLGNGWTVDVIAHIFGGLS